MSGSPEPESRHSNGKGGAIASVSHTLIKALPPHFLLLVIINAGVLGFLFWFIDARAKHTAEVLNQLLTACLNKG
jgi:type VI protein secretion system component VasF